ncbi:MAG TPA: hypothetical protein VFU23_00505 [Gemmatimonadales bacterium]|nr:hypothetical protein [Gemmatimonadales bacterium]
MADLSDRHRMEQRHADQAEKAAHAAEREVRRVYRQCIGLAFAGVPIYALSWHFTDPSTTRLAVALALFVSYALPFFRWLGFIVSRSEHFD